MDPLPPVSPADAARLVTGEPPADPDLLRMLALDRWVAFLRQEYLDGFIAAGGAKVKLLIGTPGTGKSHQLALAAAHAREAGYLVAEVDARQAERIFPLDRLYGAVTRQLDLDALAAHLGAALVAEVGYELAEVPAGSRFLDWVERDRGAARAPLERRLWEALGRITRDPALDLTFGTALGHLAAHHVGLETLNESEEAALRRWFQAEKVGLTDLRPLRLYKRADRYNARAFLRSLAAAGRLAGYRGMVVAVDNLDALLERDSETGRLRYTRGVRDEAYEAIRELIDDVDEAHAMLWLFAGRRGVLEDERGGISSYEALRLRLLPEVRSARFNPYTDVVDLDQARALGYFHAGDLRELRERAEALAPAVRAALAECAVEVVPAPSSPGGVRQIVLAGIHHDQ